MTRSIKRSTQFLALLLLVFFALMNSQSANAQCDIANLDPFFECEGDDLVLYYSFDYPPSWPDNESYRLYINGEQVGGQLTLGGVNEWSTLIGDESLEGQSVSVGVGVWPYSDDCIITVDNIGVPVCDDCLEPFTPFITCGSGLDIYEMNLPPHDSILDIYIDDELLLTLNPNSDSVMYPFISEESVITFIAVDTETECEHVWEFDLPEDCSPELECQVLNLFAEVYCVDGNVFVDFEFDAVDFENDFFDYSLGGQTYYAEVGETFYTIENVDLSPGFYVLTVSENDNPDCAAALDIEIVCCDQPELEGIFADANCADILTQLEVTGDTNNPSFIYNWQGPDGPGPQGVDEPVWNLSDPASPGLYTLTVTNTEDNCTIEFAINMFAGGDGSSFQGADVCVGAEGSVLIYPDEDSSIAGQFGGPLCAFVGVNCGIDPAGVPYVEIDQVAVALNGPGLVGTSSNLIYSLGSTASPCFSFTSQPINFLDESECANDCEVAISALGTCDGDVYYVDIVWTGLNVPTVNPDWEYTIQGNGTNYGTYPVNQTELQLGPFSSDQTINEFGITFFNDGVAECQGATGIAVPECPASDCSITNFDYIVNCVGNEVNFSFQFNATGFTNNFFDYSIGGITGFQELGEPWEYYTVEGLDLVPGTYVLTVSENDNPSCFASLDVTIPDCPFGSDNCFFPVETDVICDGSVFYVEISWDALDTQGVSADYEYVISNNIDGTSLAVAQDQSEATVGPFDLPENGLDLFISFTDGNLVLCESEIGISTSDCQENECEISNVVAESLGCEDGMYHVVIDFDASGIPSGSTQFGINGNGNQYGTWNYADAPVVLGPFSPDQTINEFAVFDTSLGNDCQNYAEFEAPLCSEAIDFAEVVGCDQNTVSISVDPSVWNQNDADSFVVNVFEDGIPPGDPEGPFLFADGTVTIDMPFTGDDCAMVWVTIVDAENPVILMSTTIVVCPCTEGDVWPGDTNNDGVANNFDFLNIGLAYGSQGAQRPAASISWFGQFCPNWVQNFFSGLNFKFTDCDGNGVVNGLDGLAIDQNYGSTHGKTEGEEGTEDEAPLYVDFPDQTLSPGEEVSFPIIFGNSDDPIESVYGFAFSIEYEDAMLNEPEIVFTESWLGTEFVDALSFVKHFPNEKRFEIAFTRINQLNAAGFGVVGHVRGILIENIEGYQVGQTIPININISNVGILDATEQEVPFSLTPESGAVATGIEDNSLEISIYPVPASDYLMLELPTLSKDVRINVLNSNGQVVRSQTMEENTQRIDLGDLANGIYFIEIVDIETRMLRKIDIIR